MKICPKCKTAYSDDKKFCKTCGVQLLSTKENDPKFSAKKMVLEEKIKTDPLNISLLTELAELFIENKLYDEAILILYKILAIEENNLKVQQYLFHCLNVKGKKKEAAEIGYKLVDLTPDNKELLLEVALLAMDKEDNARALDYIDRIIENEPRRKDVWKYKAELLGKIDDKEKAIIAWNNIYNIDSNDIDARLYLGIEAAKKGEYGRTKELIESIIEKIKDKTQKRFLGLVYLVKSYLNLNLDEKSITDLYSKIIDISQPDWLDDEVKLTLSDVAFSLGQKALEKEDYNVALSYFENVGEYGNTKKSKEASALTYYKMSEEYYVKKDLVNAEHYLSESLKLDPTNVEVKEKHLEITDKIKAIKKKRINKIILTISIIAIACIVVLISIKIIQNYNEKKFWETAKQENTSNSYQTYIDVYPNGNFLHEADKLREKTLWNEALQSNKIELYDKYISLYDHGDHIVEAISKREDLYWKETEAKNTIESYNDYITSYPNGRFINDALRNRNKLLLSSLSIEKIKNDLLGNHIPGWNFDYLSEFKNVELTNSVIEGNVLMLYANLKLEGYNTKQTSYAKIIIKYNLQNDKSWQFLNVIGYYYSNVMNKYSINSRLFIIGKWRWQDNTAEYKSDGTWEGTWNNGSMANGTWAIVQDQLYLYNNNISNPWLIGKIVSVSNSRIEIDFNGIKNIAERLNDNPLKESSTNDQMSTQKTESSTATHTKYYDFSSIPSDMTLQVGKNPCGIGNGKFHAEPTDGHGNLTTNYIFTGIKSISAKIKIVNCADDWENFEGLAFMDNSNNTVSDINSYINLHDGPNHRVFYCSGGIEHIIPTYGTYYLEMSATTSAITYKVYDSNNRLLYTLPGTYEKGKSFPDIYKLQIAVYGSSSGTAIIDDLKIAYTF